MSGTFILSLDCEGKWGSADRLTEEHDRLLTDRALCDAYRSLVEMFARYNTPATFGYVTAFVMTATERAGHPLIENRTTGDPWLRHYWNSCDRGSTEGWFVPDALDIVGSDARHEIASHSFCHRPLVEYAVPAALAAEELDAVEEFARMRQLNFETFIFPRNQQAHVSLLETRKYIGYRTGRAVSGRARAIKSLLREFDVSTPPDPPATPPPGQPVEIPAGHFFNWRHGARRYVPPAVTHIRWRKMLDRAASDCGVVHLWLHPHNLITGAGTRESLERVVAYAAKLRDDGRLAVMTQAQYCRKILKTASEFVAPAQSAA